MVGLKKGVEEVNISKYDFHDGCLINLKHFDNKIELSMESAEISDEELVNKIILSKQNTIKGKLHLEKIESIKINNQTFSGVLKQEYDVGKIFSFQIEDNIVILMVGWENHPPKIFRQTDFYKIEIEANKIYWENTPDLVNPFR